MVSNSLKVLIQSNSQVGDILVKVSFPCQQQNKGCRHGEGILLWDCA